MLELPEESGFIPVIGNEPRYAVGFDAPVQPFSGDSARGELPEESGEVRAAVCGGRLSENPGKYIFETAEH